MSDLQVSIVTFDNRATIDDCLRAVLRETATIQPTLDVWDNASTDGTTEHVRRTYPGVRVHASPHNVGFGAAHNRVLEATSAGRVLILNPDATLLPGALEVLDTALRAEDDLALVGPRLDSPEGSPEVSFGAFPGLVADLRQRRRVRSVARGDPAARERLESELSAPMRPDWISGACMLGRTAALRRVGCFDERFFMYLEDVDLCLRLAQAGLGVALEPRARCLHRPGSSQPDREAARRHYRASRLAYERKHGSKLGAFLYRGFRGGPGTARPPTGSGRPSG